MHSQEFLLILLDTVFQIFLMLSAQVSPSFQWAQNDTAIFLSVKPGHQGRIAFGGQGFRAYRVSQSNLKDRLGLGSLKEPELAKPCARR